MNNGLFQIIAVVLVALFGFYVVYKMSRIGSQHKP